MKLFKILIGVALILLATVINSSAQSQFALTFTNVTAANAVSNSISATAVSIPSGKTVIVTPVLTPVEIGGTNIVFTFNLLVDYAYFTTTQPISITNTWDGTNRVVGYHILPYDTTKYATKIIPASMTHTGTNRFAITRLSYQFK